MKYNDEELSRILTAHANGGLEGGGFNLTAYPACLIQCGLKTVHVGFGNDEFTSQYVTYGGYWFDRNYNPLWTVDGFLAELEAEGLA